MEKISVAADNLTHHGIRQYRLNSSKSTYFILSVLIFASVVIRCLNLDAPPIHPFGFRQTQTAITIWTFVKEGISFFGYQTPVFGPPWRIPMEFPIYQVTVAVLVNIGLGSIDIAGKLVSIFYFYLSALFLYLLCRMHFEDRNLSAVILIYYLFCPFNVVYSQMIFIDFAATAFALGYLYFFLLWLNNNRSKLYFILAVIFGIFSYLSKITTTATIILPIAYFTLRSIYQDFNKSSPGLLDFINKHKRFILLLLIAIGVPVIIGVSWVKYTDYVKAASPFTEFLTSTQLKTWNFGTWDQKLDPIKWIPILSRIDTYFSPRAMLVLFVIALWCIYSYSRKEIDFLFSFFLSALLSVALFFNLYYVHDYYLMAISPALSICVGFGLYHLYHMLKNKHWQIIITSLIMVWSLFKPLPFVKSIYSIDYNHPIFKFGEYIQEVTEEDEFIIVADFDWDPIFPYFARRKAFMIKDQQIHNSDHAREFLKQHNFTTIICNKKHPKLFSNWKYKKIIRQIKGWEVIRVSDTEIK